ncbi:hypothetical protein ACPW96_18605 [Micromonospora sp. DT81.3]|uniref:hypothetical protein n=1 Tax=Micromonospora sp. DT81.3 TaxID=3416523 RepID=UPI003CEDA852
MGATDSSTFPADTVTFAEYTDELAHRGKASEGVRGMVLLGSASRAAAARRDEWSDHDFYALFEPGRADDLRRRLPFLPSPERIALVAREGAEGFAVLYHDGHLFEFGAGTTDEFGSARFDQHEILFADNKIVAWASEAAQRGANFAPESAADAAGLTLVKLMIGFGRATRGEVISGSMFVRAHAVTYLTLAIRQRIAPAAEDADADAFDPSRRFEVDYPEISRRIGAALGAPVVDAARELLTILRGVLEPGWAEFPTAAADIVAARFN